MKFNIEVDLVYIDENGCLDDSIKQSILNSVTAIVMKKVEKQIDAKLDAIVVKAANDKANKIVDEITTDFITKEFTKIDRYGDSIETGLTVKDLLKRSFDDFWKEKVNKSGQKGSYGETMTRVEWKIEALIKEHSLVFADKLTKDTENKIKAMMRNNLSQSIGAKLVTELGFDKILMERNK